MMLQHHRCCSSCIVSLL